jgi:hypothetical protein
LELWFVSWPPANAVEQAGTDCLFLQESLAKVYSKIQFIQQTFNACRPSLYRAGQTVCAGCNKAFLVFECNSSLDCIGEKSRPGFGWQPVTLISKKSDYYAWEKMDFAIIDPLYRANSHRPEDPLF